MLLKIVYGNRTSNLCTEAQKRIFNAILSMDGIFCYCILMWTVLNEMKLTYVFHMLKNSKPTECGMNDIHNLLTKPHKKIRTY